MFRELVKRNLIKLKNLSLFKLLICILITVFFNHPIVVCLLFLYLICNSYYDGFFYLFLILVIFYTNTNNLNLINYGIIEEIKDKYYVVDSFIYKTSLYTNDRLFIGDIVRIDNCVKNNEISLLKKNIVFKTDVYKLLNCFKLRKNIYEYINSFNEDIRICLNKFIYNLNNYDDNDINLSYSFVLYYFFRLLSRKNKILCLVLLVIYCLIFNNQIKFILIFIDLLLSLFKISKLDKLCIMTMIILILNIHLIKNNSILIALLFSFYNYLNMNIGFKTYMFIINSFVFKQINIIYTFGYKYILKLQFFILIFSFLILIFPSLSNIYLRIINIYSYINNLNISIRGSLSIIGVILFIFAYKIVSNEYLLMAILCLIIISPLNYPFYSVDFIDVGQGDAILIKNYLNRSNILIDTGSLFNYYKLQKYLYSKGIYTLDYLIITHNDSDHNGNIDNLYSDFAIQNIIEAPEDIKYKNIYLKSINTKQYDNDNDNSLVYELSINNLNFLFTGDISKECEKDLINNHNLSYIDVLKVSHHGSNSASSSYFLGNILPKFAIISTSGQYNHPHNETIKNLQDYKIKYFVTKDDGSIRFIMFKGFNLIKTGKWEFVIIKT